MRPFFRLCGVAAIGFAFTGPVVIQAGAAEEPLRTWRDVTGQYQVEARLVRVQGGSVVLKGTDNLERNVPLDKLSVADRAYLKSLEVPKAPTTPTTPQTPATPTAPATPAAAPKPAPAAPAAVVTPTAPAMPNVSEAAPASRAVPLAPRTWTPKGMPPFEAGFVDFRTANPRDAQAAMFPRDAVSVVLHDADGKEKLIAYDRLSETDQRYIENRIVERPVSDDERFRLQEPLDGRSVPAVVRSLVAVEAKAGDEVRNWPALVVQTVDGVSYVRTEPTGRALSKDMLPAASYSIVVHTTDGSRRTVAAKLLGCAESFGRLILSAPAAELPQPITEFKPKPLGSEQPVTLYGLGFNDSPAMEWEFLRCAATFRRRGPERFTFDVDFGTSPRGTAIVVGEGDAFGGLCIYPSGTAVLKPDGTETVIFSYQRMTLDPIFPAEGPKSHASDVQLRKGKEAGVAELLFMWNDLLPQGTVPRLVVSCAGTNEWLQNRRLVTISDFTVNNGELFRVEGRGMAVLECAEITDPAEVETVLKSCSPRGIVTPGNRPMKAAFRYDPAALGPEFPVSFATVRFDEKAGKYLGQGDIRLDRTVSFKQGAQNVTSY